MRRTIMKNGYRVLLSARAWLLLAALSLAACGGGGGGESGGGPSPAPGGNPPPPPPANRNPFVALPTGEKLAIIGAPFDHEVTKGGQLFRDPDGDTLTYEVKIAPNSIGVCDLTLTGLRVTGVPNRQGGCDVTVIA